MNRFTGVTLLLLLLAAGCATSVTDLSKGETGWVSYPSSIEKINLRGVLSLPENVTGQAPAMIVAHGSGGMGYVDEQWARFLNANGIAAFRIDYFGPRHIRADSHVHPWPFHDAKDARALLATHPRIDPKRIGIIGFSRGGAIALQAANFEGFAAHVGVYPPCGVVGITSRDSPAPVLILVGDVDEIIRVYQCEMVVRDARMYAGRKVELKIYEGAHHGWDGNYTGHWYHVAIGRSYRVQPNADVTARSRADVLQFLRTAFAMPGG